MSQLVPPPARLVVYARSYGARLVRQVHFVEAMGETVDDAMDGAAHVMDARCLSEGWSLANRSKLITW